MKTCGIWILALAGLGGCAAAPRMSPAVASSRSEPCRPHASLDSRDATQTFGTCLAMADGLAAARKPTAAPPETSHWVMPVMQDFIAGTAGGGGSGASGGSGAPSGAAGAGGAGAGGPG